MDDRDPDAPPPPVNLADIALALFVAVILANLIHSCAGSR